MSLLLRPALPAAAWARVTTWAAVALQRAIEQVSSSPARIKWPNDLEISGRKVAGILAESGADHRGDPFVVLGMGVNVNHAEEDFPEELASRATSLFLASGRRIDRATFAATLLHFLAASEQVMEHDFSTLVSAAALKSTLLGCAVEARAGDVLYHGVAEELDPEGHLMLRQASGELVRLTAGEVTLSGSSIPR
jgi:BirA family biotin operon repressor/biotin-[acetyl-CoA-carboxylase] ligase